MPLPLFSEGVNQAGGQGESRQRDPDFSLHFLALSQLRGLGLTSLQALIDHYYEDLGSIWRANPTSIQAVLHRAHVPRSQALAEAIHNSQPALLAEGRQLHDYLAQRNVVVLASSDPQFPNRLRDIPDAPRWLFVEGNASILNDGTFVAVVGTRNASSVGTKTAAQVTWLAAQMGLGLVSGLAEGIDAAAHTKAVQYSVPQVAVLGTGIDVTFPKSTASLRRQITDTGGCVVTEYFPNDNYGKSRFVQRNRIQAGLSAVVCPVEGRTQSGTMHTLRFAEKYKRQLFGVTRGPTVDSNDMPSLITQMGFPVFDVAEPDGQTRLRNFLADLPGARFQRPDRPNPEFLLRNVLKALDVVASYDELTREEKLYLLEEIRKRFKLDDE